MLLGIHTPATAEDDTSWREWSHEGALRQYEVRGRSWRVDVTNADGKLVRYTEVSVAATRKDGCTLTVKTSIYGKMDGKPAKWETQQKQSEVSFDKSAYGGEGWSYVGEETIKVKAGTFHCRKLQFTRGSGRSPEVLTYWASSAFRGLNVKIEAEKETTELVSFDSKPGDPDLTKSTLKTSSKGTSDEGDAPKDAEPPEPELSDQTEVVYVKKGRKWSFERTVTSTPKKGKSRMTQKTTSNFEVIEAYEKYAKVTQTDYDADGEELWSLPGTITAYEPARTPPPNFVALRYEDLSAAGKKWSCTVYRIDNGEHSPSDTTVWLSNVYLGLEVKRETVVGSSGEGKSVTLTVLVSADGFDLPTLGGIRPEIPEPPTPEVEDDPDKADWSLFRKRGRKWIIKNQDAVGTGGIESYMEYTVKKTSTKGCEVHWRHLTANRKPVGGEGQGTYEIDFKNKDHMHWVWQGKAFKSIGEETIEAAGEKWECQIYVTRNFGEKDGKTWISKKYPGLRVKSIHYNGDKELVNLLDEFK